MSFAVRQIGIPAEHKFLFVNRRVSKPLVVQHRDLMYLRNGLMLLLAAIVIQTAQRTCFCLLLALAEPPWVDPNVVGWVSGKEITSLKWVYFPCHLQIEYRDYPSAVS